MSKVLVVGAGSFIGQHLIRKLIDNGDHVTGLVRNKPENPEKWMKNVKNVLAEPEPHVVFEVLFNRALAFFRIKAANNFRFFSLFK